MLSTILRAGVQVTTLLLDKMRRLKNRLNRIKTRVERVRPGWLELHCHGLMWAGMLLVNMQEPASYPALLLYHRQVFYSEGAAPL